MVFLLDLIQASFSDRYPSNEKARQRPNLSPSAISVLQVAATPTLPAGSGLQLVPNAPPLLSNESLVRRDALPRVCRRFACCGDYSICMMRKFCSSASE